MKIFLILSFFALHTCVDAAGSSHSIPMHAQESEAIENKALCFFESPNNDVHQVFYTRAHNNPLKFTLFMTFDVSSKDKRKWRQSISLTKKLKKKPSKDESTVVLGDRNLLFSLTSMTYGGDHFIFYNKKSAILQCETMAEVDVIQFKKSIEAHLPAIGSQIDLLYRNFDNPNLISVDWTDPGYKIYLQHLMDQLHPKEERDCLATLTLGDSRYKAWLALFCDHIANTKE